MASRLTVILMSIVCLVASAYFGAEAWLLDSGKPENVRRATQWMPWSAEAWRLMPQVEPEHASAHWRHVLKLAPRDIEARIALATEAELAGKPVQAEALLKEAAQLHKGYLPAWTLANFYLRQNDQLKFWRWARRTASFEVDLTALFELCLRLRPDPAALVTELAVRRPSALGELLAAAAQEDLLEVALPVADRVARQRTAAVREQLLWDADDLLKKAKGPAALSYWNLAARENLIPYAAAHPPTLFNGDFTYAALERGFDWRPGSAEVPVSTGRGLHLGLYGKQGDTAVLIAQTVLLEPGCTYQLRYRYRTNLPRDATPVRWQMGEAASEPFEPGDWRESAWRFKAASELAELKLISRRETGTHKAQGEVEVAWVRVDKVQ